jgi:UDP-2,4-diacetamido-2,4,6-trideoxy-beta-L-altropyranose hydrolase
VRKTIAIRADASPLIGVGHIARCVALAEAWIDLGGDAILVACGPRATLDALAGAIPLRWLGADVDILPDDSARFLSVAREARATVAVIDSYRHSFTWEATARDAGLTVLAIDDLASRQHDCDFILDTSVTIDDTDLYRDKIADDAICLLGASYVLLRRAFRLARFSPRPVGPVRRILISFGGTDPQDHTSSALDALECTGTTGMVIDVVASSSNPHLPTLRDRIAACANVAIHVDTPEMPRLMAAADLGIGAAGSTAWERCRAGLPALMAEVADNQYGIAKWLRAEGVVRCVSGEGESFTKNLTKSLSAALADSDWRSSASHHAMELVDGLGAVRVSQRLMGLTVIGSC